MPLRIRTISKRRWAFCRHCSYAQTHTCLNTYCAHIHSHSHARTRIHTRIYAHTMLVMCRPLRPWVRLLRSWTLTTAGASFARTSSTWRCTWTSRQRKRISTTRDWQYRTYSVACTNRLSKSRRRLWALAPDVGYSTELWVLLASVCVCARAGLVERLSWCSPDLLTHATLMKQNYYSCPKLEGKEISHGHHQSGDASDPGHSRF